MLDFSILPKGVKKLSQINNFMVGKTDHVLKLWGETNHFLKGLIS